MYKSEGDLHLVQQRAHSKHFIKTGCIAQNVRISEFLNYHQTKSSLYICQSKLKKIFMMDKNVHKSNQQISDFLSPLSFTIYWEQLFCNRVQKFFTVATVTLTLLSRLLLLAPVNEDEIDREKSQLCSLAFEKQVLSITIATNLF